MVSLARLGGLPADAALGLPRTATPYTVEHDVAVPMPDGVSLLGNLYRPAGEPGPQPVVLLRTPYGREGISALLFGAPLARRGFQVFLQLTAISAPPSRSASPPPAAPAGSRSSTTPLTPRSSSSPCCTERPGHSAPAAPVPAAPP